MRSQNFIDTNYYRCLSYLDFVRDCDDPIMDDPMWRDISKAYVHLYRIVNKEERNYEQHR